MASQRLSNLRGDARTAEVRDERVAVGVEVGDSPSVSTYGTPSRSKSGRTIFDVLRSATKNKGGPFRTGQRTSWCTDCTREYQQDRYVRVGYLRVTAEIMEGDPCLGHDCPLCHKPFEVGQRVQGVEVAHEACLDENL